VLIRRNLTSKHLRRQQLPSNVQNNDEQLRRRDQQVFVKLLFQAIVSLVTQTPWMLLFFYTAMTIHISDKSADRLAVERFVTFTADVIVFLFPVASFHLYTLVSRTFRQELKNLLCRLLWRIWRNDLNRIYPMNVGSFAQ
jgi:hypothetical protein